MVPFRVTVADEQQRDIRDDHSITVSDRILDRVLGFFGYTIDEVVNDDRKKEHVRNAYLISKRIGRDLVDEPWRGEATRQLGQRVVRRLGLPGSTSE